MYRPVFRLKSPMLGASHAQHATTVQVTSVGDDLPAIVEDSRENDLGDVSVSRDGPVVDVMTVVQAHNFRIVINRGDEGSRRDLMHWSLFTGVSGSRMKDCAMHDAHLARAGCPQ